MVSSNLDQSSDCRIFCRNERRPSVAKRMPSVGFAPKLLPGLICQESVTASVARPGEGMSSRSRTDKGLDVRGCCVARRCGVGIGASQAALFEPDYLSKRRHERLIRPDFNRFLQIVRTNIERPPEVMSRHDRVDAPIDRGLLHRRHRPVSVFGSCAARTSSLRRIRRMDFAFTCSFACRGLAAPAVSACRCRRAVPRPAACRAGRRLPCRRSWRPYPHRRAAIRTAC